LGQTPSGGAVPRGMSVDRPAGLRTCIYDTAQLAAVIDSMARQAAGLLGGCSRIAVIGILRRGAPLADRLTEALVRRYGLPQPLRIDLSVKRYADDLTLLFPETQLKDEERQAAIELSGYTLLVVDDVLYTGHSLLRVVEYLARRQPAEIRVAVLMDRGVARLPIRADVVGVRLDIAPSDIVECNVPPYEPEFRIELLQPGRGAP